MEILNTYFKGLKKALQSLKMTTVLYFLFLFIALTVVFPFRSTLSAAIDHTMYPAVLLHGFNFTVFEDFLRNNGVVLKPFVSIVFWVGVSYFVINIFFTGGILNILSNKHGKYSTVYFFEGCGRYFFRFLRLSGLILLFNIVVALIVYLPLSFILDAYSESTEAESTLVYIAAAGILIHLILIILTLTVSDYTKIKLVTEETTKVFRTFAKSVKFTFVNFFSVYPLYLLLLGFPVFLLIAYYFTEKSFYVNSKKAILTIFLIQQLFVFARQLTKVWFFASQLYMHKSLEPEKQEVTPEQIKEWDLKNLKKDIL